MSTLIPETTRTKTEPTWGKAIAQPAKEFPLTPLSLLSGEIPHELRGSLYRNGPARLERNGQRVGHWFDGDGAILGVHFSDRGATGVYRYVQTAGYQAESKANRFLFSGYGMTPLGAIWERFGKGAKNVANTSVIAVADKLLALWEGGQPHALDFETLTTIGLDNLNSLANQFPYSAHPKRDPVTGEIFNFGVTFGKNAALRLYKSDRAGQIQLQNSIPLEGLPILHDFVMAGKYLIFFIPPVRLNPFPVLLNLKSYSDSLAWQPQKGTQVLVVDRDTLNLVSRNEVEPWYQWHFGNGYVNMDGDAVIDLVKYKDFRTNQFLKEIATGEAQTAAKGTLCQIRLDPKSGKLLQMQEVLDRGCEFPVVNPHQVGRASRYSYCSIHRRDADLSRELFGAIASFDYQTGILQEADFGANCYPMEPIFAPNPSNPETGWILTVVFDGKRDCSEVWVFDRDRLNEQPVCRLALPSVVPMGFHGTWRSTGL
ncbi:Dioxygenase [Tumidithrix helvetica PCC 7403]|uniref:carotenoid oxygenase family protein n=1 Tax=Tumidithrix helvetica TaxID=3457545 RepID=UPI003CBC43C2